MDFTLTIKGTRVTGELVSLLALIHEDTNFTLEPTGPCDFVTDTKKLAYILHDLIVEIPSSGLDHVMLGIHVTLQGLLMQLLGGQRLAVLGYLPHLVDHMYQVTPKIGERYQKDYLEYLKKIDTKYTHPLLDTMIAFLTCPCRENIGVLENDVLHIVTEG